MIRIIIADDHNMFREGIIGLLTEAEGIEIIGEAGNGREAWKMIQERSPDIALLDVGMPRHTGIEVARMILKADLATRIILLTQHRDPSLAHEAATMGVHGYILKDNTFKELVQALWAVARGERFWPVDLLQTEQSIKRAFPKFGLLSQRERQILEKIARGRTNKEIAKELQLSPSTIGNHRNRIIQKLDLHTTTTSPLI